MIRVGIVGATGYTGLELLRLLSRHPNVDISVVTSRTEVGKKVSDFFPGLRGVVDVSFSQPDAGMLSECDLVFFATPHAVAMHSMKALLDLNTRVIDLSADFRIKNVALWEKWYGCKHVFTEGIEQAVYGLPEVNREAIRQAALVAAPGCYPTSVQLGFLPLLEAGIIDTNDLVANSASGVSGAGRTARIDYLYTECNDNFQAYAIKGHRHLPEIEQGLEAIAKTAINLTFVPHLLPMSRGIVSTLYANLNTDADLKALYESRYCNEPFVDFMSNGALPSVHGVRGSNFCRIAVERPQGRDKVVIVSAIDNLVKGASGQAIQIMNIMFDLDEKCGLDLVPFAP